jgi:hypothetical protein
MLAGCRLVMVPTFPSRAPGRHIEGCLFVGLSLDEPVWELKVFTGSCRGLRDGEVELKRRMKWDNPSAVYAIDGGRNESDMVSRSSSWSP